MQITAAITATKVADDARENFFVNYLDQYFLLGELAIYNVLSSLSEDYNGGYWEFYDLSNGGFYIAPITTKNFRIECTGNYYSGTLSADASGIVATLYALNDLACRTENEKIIDLFHALRDFVDTHAEAGKIFQAID